MDFRLNKITSRVDKFVLPLVFIIIIGILRSPWPIRGPGSGLDPSWDIGINVAFLRNLQFGVDIAFPYGPLGFLWHCVPVDYNLWCVSLFFNIFTHFLFIGSIFLLLKRLSAKWYQYVIFIPILIFAIPTIEYKLVIIVSIYLFMLILSTESNRKDLVGLGFMGLLLSIATLIKFNAFFMGISIILMTFPVCMLAKKSVKYGTYLLISYLISLISLWLVIKQNLANFILYLYNGIEITRGYSGAMAVQGQSWQVYVGLISIISLLVLFIYSIKENKRNILLFLLLNLGILFAAFKHGFVRQGGQVLLFFTVYLLFFGIVLILALQEIPNTKTRKISYSTISLSTVMILILMFSVYFTVPGILNDNIVKKPPSYGRAGDLLSNSTLFHEYVEFHKGRIRQDYPLDQRAIIYINKKTVDVFPWDIALCWAYNLNWSPRPVFQSYTAYTQHLDTINSRHFMGNKSPQTILYAYKSIDGRYPLFDEPYTFANILRNYTFLGKSGTFLLLSRNPKENAFGLEEDLGTVKVEIGQPIKIPTYDPGYVFGRITLEYSTFGKIMKFIYKPAFARIRFKFYDSSYSKDFRFIPGVSRNGVFLSHYVGTIDDLAAVFSDKITQDITEVIIEVDNPIYYKKYIRVNFVGVPANISIQNASNGEWSVLIPIPKMPAWHVLKHVKGGIPVFDAGGNIQNSKEGDTVYVDKIINQLVEITGWAPDDLTNGRDVKTYLVFRSDDYGVFLDGDWYIDTDGDQKTNIHFRYGTGGDIPVVGDFNQEGDDDYGVFRDGDWNIDTDRDQKTDMEFRFGTAGDLPVVGDFNQDGDDDYGVFRDGDWNIDTDGDRKTNIHFRYGTAGDLPVVGDFNQDGDDDYGVFSEGDWYIDTDWDQKTNMKFKTDEK